MIKASLLHIIGIFLILSLLAACNVTKKLPPNENLYYSAKVEIKDDTTNRLSKKEKSALVEKLEPLLKPKPVKKTLGIPLKLWVYQTVGEPKKEKGIRNWLRTKLGEPPVYASSVNLQNNETLLTNRMENLGYFHAESKGDTTVKNKKAYAVFTVEPGVQYTIRKVGAPKDSIIVEANRGGRRRKNGTRTLLKEGNPYDLDVFVAERERIDSRLKRRGYYFFQPDYVLLRVDSTVGNNQVDVFEVIKKETPQKALEKYYINNIYIYPHYDLSLDTIDRSGNDVVKFEDFNVIDPTNSFKPQMFARTMFFNKGDVYNEKNHGLTINRLVSLNQFKFVKSKFEELTVADTPKLDVYFYLTPLQKKSLRAELNGKVNTAGYTGAKFDVSWRHRNIFHGGEMFIQKVYTGLDFQVSGQNKGYNVFSMGAESSITWPRIVPFHFKTGAAYIPHTRLTIGYDWQQRQKLYTLNTGRGSFGYIWKSTEEEEHEFNIANVTYVNSSRVSQEYLDKIKQDSTLAKVIEKQLIFGPTYTYTYTNTMKRFRKNTFYYQGGLDLSGNVLGMIQGAKAKEDNYKTLLGVRYSQYFKTEQDGRHYLKLGQNTQWANRLYIGYGLPWGNSLQLPFIKQFYSGGSQSLRGFRTRTVGPGTYRPQVGPDDFLPDQTADIKLELNTELRFKIISVIHGAVFVDAGNIWLKNEDPLKPGAKFTSKFLSQLAVDAGFGLRFDFSILILRTDFGIPLRKPWLPDGEEWVIDNFDFGNKSWRKENLVFNLAVGLPF